MKKKNLAISIGFTLAIVFSTNAQNPTQDSQLKTVSFSDLSTNNNAITNTKFKKEDLWFEVKPKSFDQVSQALLNEAIHVKDIVPDFPTSWIQEFVSVEVASSIGNKKMKIVDNNPLFTVEQLAHLKNIDLGAELSITIDYKIRNSVTKELDDRKMEVSYIVTPEQEAVYEKGQDELVSYFKTKGLNQFEDQKIEEYNLLAISFFIDENGKAEILKILQSSGFENVDTHFVNLIKNMPKWKPAKDINGNLVKQDFEFYVGPPGC